MAFVFAATSEHLRRKRSGVMAHSCDCCGVNTGVARTAVELGLAIY